MLTIALTFVPAVLILLHFFTNERTKGKLKNIVQESYIKLDATADHQQLASMLVAYRWQLKSARKWFIIFFSLATLVCFLSTFYTHLVRSREDLEKALSDDIRFDIDKHYELTFTIATAGRVGNLFYEVGPTSCTPRGRAMFHFVDVKPGQAKRLTDAVHEFSDWQLRTVFLMKEAIQVIYTYLAILLALLLSFSVTSALMYWFIQSRLMIFVTFLVTIVIAVIAPFLMIETVTYLLSLVALNAFGTLPDFYYIAQTDCLEPGFRLRELANVPYNEPAKSNPASLPKIRSGMGRTGIGRLFLWSHRCADRRAPCWRVLDSDCPLQQIRLRDLRGRRHPKLGRVHGRKLLHLVLGRLLSPDTVTPQC
jgi:hypothetical protein